MALLLLWGGGGGACLDSGVDAGLMMPPPPLPLADLLRCASLCKAAARRREWPRYAAWIRLAASALCSLSASAAAPAALWLSPVDEREDMHLTRRRVSFRRVPM
jgi:hypothetical protein